MKLWYDEKMPSHDCTVTNKVSGTFYFTSKYCIILSTFTFELTPTTKTIKKKEFIKRKTKVKSMKCNFKNFQAVVYWNRWMFCSYLDDNKRKLKKNISQWSYGCVTVMRCSDDVTFRSMAAPTLFIHIFNDGIPDLI